MHRLFALSLFCLVILGGCNTSSDKKETAKWKVVNSRNFSVRLPSYLKQATELHDDAVMQYQNVIKEFYFIVIQEPTAEFNDMFYRGELEDEYTPNIDGYARLIGDRFSENVDTVYQKTALKPIIIDGKDGRYFEANAKVGTVDVHYHYGFVRGDTTYYQLLSWTLMDKASKYNDTMSNILHSFKEK